MKNKKRRLLPVAIALVAIVALSGVAYAYWSSTGSGSGSATTSTSVALTATATSAPALVPGGNTTVTVVVTNSATFSQSFNAVAISVTPDVAPADPTDAVGLVGCKVAWFTNPVPAGGAVIPANSTATVTGTLHMLETGTNQDACKSKTIPLTLAIS